MILGKKTTHNHGGLMWNTMYDGTSTLVDKKLWLSLNPRLTNPLNSSVGIVRGMIILIKHENANRKRGK